VLTGLHSEGMLEWDLTLCQDPMLKASSGAFVREYEGAPRLIVLTKLQQRAEGPKRPRICRKLHAMSAASYTFSGAGWR